MPSRPYPSFKLTPDFASLASYRASVLAREASDRDHIAAQRASLEDNLRLASRHHAPDLVNAPGGITARLVMMREIGARESKIRSLEAGMALGVCSRLVNERRIAEDQRRINHLLQTLAMQDHLRFIDRHQATALKIREDQRTMSERMLADRRRISKELTDRRVRDLRHAGANVVGVTAGPHLDRAPAPGQMKSKALRKGAAASPALKAMVHADELLERRRLVRKKMALEMMERYRLSRMRLASKPVEPSPAFMLTPRMW